MSKFVFTDPDNVTNYARVALEGPPGSGKTWTALVLARAFAGADGKVGLIDTERNSAARYRAHFRFVHVPMTSYAPSDLTEAVVDATEQGVTVLVIDSGSLFWEGSGGMLEQVDLASAAAGRTDKFGSGWNAMRPVEQQMWNAVLSFPGHVIMTLRVKTDYAVEPDPRHPGKTTVRKIGLKPIQRENVAHEFDIVGDMSDAVLTVTKTRCPDLFGQSYDRPTEELGYTILDWLDQTSMGEHIDPLVVRDWALDPARTVDELATRREEITRAGLGGTAVRSPSGRVGPLCDFLAMCERRIRVAAEQGHRGAPSGASSPALAGAAFDAAQAGAAA